MKQEVFKERLDALNVKINVIENEIRELQEVFAATYPIQPVHKRIKCINLLTDLLTRMEFHYNLVKKSNNNYEQKNRL